MGCGGSKSAAAIEPSANAPKTLLTSDSTVSDKGETKGLATFVAALSGASDTEVRATLESLPIAELRRLEEALNKGDADISGGGPSAEAQASSLEALERYCVDANSASEDEVSVALQGLGCAERAKLLAALNSLPVMDAESPACDSGKIAAGNGVDAPADLGVSAAEIISETSLAEGDPKVSDGAVVVSSTAPLADARANGPWASPFANCCTAPTDATTEFVAESSSRLASDA